MVNCRCTVDEGFFCLQLLQILPLAKSHMVALLLRTIAYQNVPFSSRMLLLLSKISSSLVYSNVNAENCGLDVVILELPFDVILHVSKASLTTISINITTVGFISLVMSTTQIGP